MIFQDGQKHLATSMLHWLQGGRRRTALHWACQRGDVKCVEALVAAGADTTVGAALPLALWDAQQGQLGI